MGTRFGLLIIPCALKIANGGAESFFKQSQPDGTAPIFAIAGLGEDLSAGRTRLVTRKSETKKIPSIHFLVIFFLSFPSVNGSWFTVSTIRWCFHQRKKMDYCSCGLTSRAVQLSNLPTFSPVYLAILKEVKVTFSFSEFRSFT
jgi:hypothetical protein